MATNPLIPAVSAFDLTTDYKVLYDVPVNINKAGIDAVVFNNYSAQTADFSVRIVQSGTGTVLNEIISSKQIRAGRNDLAPAMIGQALQTGGEIQAKASANDSISVSITVTEITT